MPIFQLTDDLVFPPPQLAEEGLLAVGGDLSRQRLLLAYRNGIFPWYSEGEPLLWWSPDPRMLIFPGSMHVSRRLRRTLRQGVFTVTLDTAFPDVVTACATIPRRHEAGTWITRAVREAFVDLHAAGYAHAVECWREGALVGGVYGLSLGACFFGESMFSAETNASKVALVTLAAECHARGIEFIDCQLPTEHLRRLGGVEEPRSRFLRRLEKAVQAPAHRGPWRRLTADPALPPSVGGEESRAAAD